MGMRAKLSRLGLIRSEAGRRAVGTALAHRLLERVGPALEDVSLRPEDLVDYAALRLPVPAAPPPRGRPLRIVWVTTPPGRGSGGHTTMFRMVRALEDAGHECVLALYDAHGTPIAERERIVREGWPWIRARVCTMGDGLAECDAAIATAWQTAHALARFGTSPMRRLYFIQDYEPLFYPRGTEAALAEQTYRFGFRMIALGEMVAGHILREVAVSCDVVPFGCDTDTYHLTGTPEARAGVVFYTVPGAARRGFLLNMMALEEFHRLCPEQPIHAYGSERSLRLPFPVTWHGRISPGELNQLYNSCRAGLATSFTNISLVAEEMLAAGCIPVVNDDPDARADLPNEHVTWSRANPAAVAKALAGIIAHPEPAALAAAATASVRRGWGSAQSGVVRIVEEEVYGC